MQFAAQAAKYFPNVEIIELYHDKKKNAPSGTAIKTAELIAKVRESIQQGAPDKEELIAGARGANFEGGPLAVALNVVEFFVVDFVVHVGVGSFP